MPMMAIGSVLSDFPAERTSTFDAEAIALHKVEAVAMGKKRSVRRRAVWSETNLKQYTIYVMILRCIHGRQAATLMPSETKNSWGKSIVCSSNHDAYLFPMREFR